MISARDDVSARTVGDVAERRAGIRHELSAGRRYRTAYREPGICPTQAPAARTTRRALWLVRDSVTTVQESTPASIVVTMSCTLSMRSRCRDQAPQSVDKNHVVYCAVVGVEHCAQRVRQRGLELVELLRVEPYACLESCFPEALDSVRAQRDLQDSESVERNYDTSAVGQKLDVGWVAVARRDAKIVGRPGGPFDRRCKHSRGGRGGFAGAVLADQCDGRHPAPPTLPPW